MLSTGQVLVTASAVTVSRSCLSANRLPDSAHRLTAVLRTLAYVFDVNVETSSSLYVTLILRMRYVKYAM